MKRILLYAHAPYLSTSYACVIRRICDFLQKTGTYEVEVCPATTEPPPPSYSPAEYPYVIHAPVPGDALHPIGLFNTRQMQARILEGNFDILFLFHDQFALELLFEAIAHAKKEGKQFTTITYIPVFSLPVIKKHPRCLREADYPVLCSSWGLNLCLEAYPELKNKLRCIYHATEPDIFFPLPEQEKRTARSEVVRADDETFTVVNVNQNQPRKDLERSMEIYHAFHTVHPRSKLYLHSPICAPHGNLVEQAHRLGLVTKGPGQEVVFTNPSVYDQGGLPRKMMNQIYNAANVIISTAWYEGFGLSSIEAFCAKIPVIFPKNSSLRELVGANEERGYLAACGVTENDWGFLPGSSGRALPRTNQKSMLEKLEQVYADWNGSGYTGETAEKIERAYEWAQNHSWSSIGKQWLDLFDSIAPTNTYLHTSH